MLEIWRAGGANFGAPPREAEAIEAQGWDSQMFMDSQCLSADPWAQMEVWASATVRLLLSTGVTNSLTRNLAVTDGAAVTVQAISGGRVVLGIGRGDSAHAYLGHAPMGARRFERALVDVTDARSPAAFNAMMSAFPQIALLEMVDCLGTEADRANLRLGRMIRAAGIATYVPAVGSLRSCGVELFLAGVERRADPGAEFAVHAWIDDEGRQAAAYALHAPENAKYLAY
ncbi:MAG: LLM class flavin-dependent oxidoreductase [Alphaproteobacteria bacterium]|nr:LLM class flavin-dependent oxidoreductase [Alphaproteobacteria bacterium]